MNIDFFYRIVHLSMTLIMIGLILVTWVRYLYTAKNINTDRNKNSNSMLFFALALLMWEYNLFDTDYRYEVFTTIVVDGLLLVAATYFNDGILLGGQKTTYAAVRSVPVVSIVLIFLSNVVINNCPVNTDSAATNQQNLLFGYSMALGYTLFTCIVISYRLFRYYQNRNLPEIGIVSCILFAGLFLTIVLSIIFESGAPVTIGWIKAFYLITTFGLYLVFANLSFNFLQDIIQQGYFKMFSNAAAASPSAVQETPPNSNPALEIQRLIVADKIEEVVEMLLAEPNQDATRMTTLIMLANQLSSINTARIRDTIDNETYRQSRNRIVDGLLKVVH